jgi:DNA-binding NarL/FixJ family response regulator
MLMTDPELEVVGSSADAEHALLELETLAVDAVLMDILLPGMGGIEATRLLKEQHADLAVVVLTSYQGEYFEAAIEAGATGYIMKSCQPEQLVQAVRLACQGHLLIDPSITRNLARELTQLRQAHRALLLTPRHVEILRMVARGRRYKEIASTLFASERTVHREIRTIFDRLGVNDAAHAVSEAYKMGLI